MFNEEIENLKRSWSQNWGTQLATIAVLVASFSVVTFVLLMVFNFNSILVSWGDTIKITAYIKDSITKDKLDKLKESARALPNVATVEYLDKDGAAKLFKEQMASYAPALLSDVEFGNPFPASLILNIKASEQATPSVSELESVAQKLQALDGVEDVSYGQSWVKNYTGFIEAISGSGAVLIGVLMAGSLLVISNSIRTGIASRKEEIEILELLGATARSIRSPFIFEGGLQGFVAASIAIGLNFAAFVWLQEFIKTSMSLSRLVEQSAFLPALQIALIMVCGICVGALSAYLTVRQLNTGWAAAERQTA